MERWLVKQPEKVITVKQLKDRRDRKEWRTMIDDGLVAGVGQRRASLDSKIVNFPIQEKLTTE